MAGDVEEYLFAALGCRPEGHIDGNGFAGRKGLFMQTGYGEVR